MGTHRLLTHALQRIEVTSPVILLYGLFRVKLAFNRQLIHLSCASARSESESGDRTEVRWRSNIVSALIEILGLPIIKPLGLG